MSHSSGHNSIGKDAGGVLPACPAECLPAIVLPFCEGLGGHRLMAPSPASYTGSTSPVSNDSMS